MSSTPRIVGLTTVTSMALGLLATAVVVLVDEAAETARFSLLTVAGFSNLVFIGIFASFPISVPTGLAGGLLAAGVAARQSQRSMANWVGYGSLWGAAIGAVATALWFSILNWEFGLLALAVSPVGAATGGVTGAVVGWYCSQEVAQAAG
jgi:hypothetical protein